MGKNEDYDAITHQLDRSVHALFRKLYLRNGDPGSRTQGKILKILYMRGSMSQKEMQEKLDIQSGSISELISKLEKKGLVIRQPDSFDRRRMILLLTEKGREDVEAYSRRYENHVLSFFQVLDESEKQELERILEKLLSQESEK